MGGGEWFQYPSAAQNWGNSPKYGIVSRLYALQVLPKRTVTLSDIYWKCVVLSLNQLSCYVHNGWRETPRHSSQINIQFTLKKKSSLQLYLRTQHWLWQTIFIIGDNKNLSHRPIIVNILKFSFKWLYLTRLFDLTVLFWIYALQGVRGIFQDWCVCARMRALRANITS